jgi:hypothetical protein
MKRKCRRSLFIINGSFGVCGVRKNIATHLLRSTWVDALILGKSASILITVWHDSSCVSATSHKLHCSKSQEHSLIPHWQYLKAIIVWYINCLQCCLSECQHWEVMSCHPIAWHMCEWLLILGGKFLSVQRNSYLNLCRGD